MEPVERYLKTSRQFISGATKHEACPECRSRGVDTRGDNLGRYPDGHAWCFSCGYYEPPDVEKQMFNAFKAAPEWRQAEYDAMEDFVRFPTDYTRYIPVAASKWLAKYINFKEITKYRFGWSGHLQRIIMPVFDDDNRVLAWCGRSLHGTPKYLTRGKISDMAYVLYPPDWDLNKVVNTGTLEVVLVEGYLDAIKVSRVCPAVPLLGSHASTNLIRKLATRFELLGVWLDPDKTASAVRTALRASQFMPSYVVTSTQDPKDYPEDMVVTMLEQSGRQDRRIWKETDVPPS